LNLSIQLSSWAPADVASSPFAHTVTGPLHLIGFKAAHVDLLAVQFTDDYRVFHCMHCERTLCFAKKEENTFYVDGDCLSSKDKIGQLTQSPSYSLAYHILMDVAPAECHKSQALPSSVEDHAVFASLQRQLEDCLDKERQYMVARIRAFEAQERAKFASVESRAVKDRDEMYREIVRIKAIKGSSRFSPVRMFEEARRSALARREKEREDEKRKKEERERDEKEREAREKEREQLEQKEQKEAEQKDRAQKLEQKAAALEPKLADLKIDAKPLPQSPSQEAFARSDLLLSKKETIAEKPLENPSVGLLRKKSRHVQLDSLDDFGDFDLDAAPPQASASAAPKQFEVPQQQQSQQPQEQSAVAGAAAAPALVVAAAPVLPEENSKKVVLEKAEEPQQQKVAEQNQDASKVKRKLLLSETSKTNNNDNTNAINQKDGAVSSDASAVRMNFAIPKRRLAERDPSVARTYAPPALFMIDGVQDMGDSSDSDSEEEKEEVAADLERDNTADRARAQLQLEREKEDARLSIYATSVPVSIPMRRR
jgi:hypothetical protein